jgi:hypothetical protein
LQAGKAMEIRFISTLTPEDEENIAPSILRAAAAILDQTGLAYTLRIETTSERVFQHNHPAVAIGSPAPHARRITDLPMRGSIVAES